MDRIEQLMKNAKPSIPDPGTTPGVLPGRSYVFSDDPNAVSLADRKSRRTGWTATAGVALAAAAVVGAVVVAGNFVPQSAPAPATTVTASPTVTPSATASPTPTTTPTETPVGGPHPTPETTEIAPPPAPQTVGPAAGECTPANIDIQRYDPAGAILKPIPAEQQQYYTVLGCAEGWLAYAIATEGGSVIGLDGGDVFYNLATLQSDGRYLTDFEQLWTSVHNWEFLQHSVQDGRWATVQDAMDNEFATNGIPVRLREQLVGTGPSAPSGTGTP